MEMVRMLLLYCLFSLESTFLTYFWMLSSSNILKTFCVKGLACSLCSICQTRCALTIQCTVIYKSQILFTKFLYSIFIMFRGRLTQNDQTLDQSKFSHTTKINQNIGETLHKQIETYTRKFQQQKRKLFRAQQNHRQILKDYQNQVSDLQNLKTKKYQTQISNLNAKIKCLQINMQKGIVAYNDALSRNNKLKNEIDELRKDKKNQSEAFRLLMQKVEELNSSIRNMDQDINIKKMKVQKTKEQILDIRDKNQTQNSQHINNVDDLKNSVCFNNSSIRETLKNVGNKQGTEASDTTPIVKLRIRNLMHINKQKIKIAQLYKKSMEKIEQSFEQIKQESGISDLQQITKTFLKQQQQNTFIFEYINKLNTDLQSIKDENQALSKQIQKQQKFMNEQQNSSNTTSFEQRQKNKIEAYYAERQKIIENLNNFLKAIQPNLVEILHLPTKEGESFLSYSNVYQHLASLQELINLQFPNKSSDASNNQQVKSEFTKYSKVAPSLNLEDIKDRNDQAMMEQVKLRDYATDFWDKKKQSK